MSHPIATPEQHEHELEALELTRHPTVRKAYDRVRDHLKASGLEVLELGGARGQMWVSDPAGNVLEFTTDGA